MEKLNRWVAKHVWPIFIGGLFLFIFLILLLIPPSPPVYSYVCLFASYGIFFGFGRWVFSRSAVLLKKPVSILSHTCDPYPFLEEVQVQQNYPGNRSAELSHVTNLATALQETGEYDRMDQLLTSTPEETVRKAHAVNQAIYFGLMFSVYARQKNTQELEQYHRKLLNTYGTIKFKRYRALLEPMMVSHHAAYHYARQEYAQGLQLLEDFPVRTLRDRVVQAYSLAKFHLALNEKETARELLDFVIKNGNKLFVVAEAQELLTTINSEE